MDNITYEICVDSLDKALDAQNKGADRIELCEELIIGGITPSKNLILSVRKNLNIKIHALIRPRGGNFVYNDYELKQMENDILFCRDYKIDGIVFGILDKENKIDKINCKKLVDISRPMQTTFHKAFDVVKNPIKALEDIIKCGFDRILTSGCKQTAEEGILNLKNFIRIAGNKIIIMPGGKIRKENLGNILNKTGAKEIHSSSSVIIKKLF
jgi:copper homeostasis protein